MSWPLRSVLNHCSEISSGTKASAVHSAPLPQGRAGSRHLRCAEQFRNTCLTSKLPSFWRLLALLPFSTHTLLCCWIFPLSFVAEIHWPASTQISPLCRDPSMSARFLSSSAARVPTEHWLAALANGAHREKATRAELCCATPRPQALQICNSALLLFFLISRGSQLIWSWHQQEA